MAGCVLEMSQGLAVYTELTEGRCNQLIEKRASKDKRRSSNVDCEVTFILWGIVMVSCAFRGPVVGLQEAGLHMVLRLPGELQGFRIVAVRLSCATEPEAGESM